MRVCFLLPSLRPSGGVSVAAEHARRLSEEHGVVAELVVLDEGGIRDAAGSYDVAISTWWQTVPALWELDAKHRVSLLQGFEQRFYDRDAPFDRLHAEAMLALPLDFIVVAPWMRELLGELRPDARSWLVPPGVDKETFSAERRTRRRSPLEVLIEGQPNLPFKGVAEAVAAVRSMREPVRSTLVALDPDEVGDIAVDRVVGGLDAAGMAALYRDSDILVKLSRVESLGLAPLEGFHAGLPCVVTPYTGHSEYVRHGENGVVCGFDDVPGTATWLDRLARDRELLAELGAGALRTAASWPSRQESTRILSEALAELAEGPPPTGGEAFLLRALALNGQLGRARLSRRSAATEHALTSAERLVRELSASRDECGETLEATRAELERVRATFTYRLGRAAKRAGRVLRRG